MKYDQQTVNRIKRLEGQMRGILKMMDDDKECRDVITQLTAVRSAIDKTIGLIVSENLVNCVIKGQNKAEDNQKLIQDAVKLLIKSQ